MRKIGVVIPGVVQMDYLGELYRGITDAALQNRCTLVTSIHNARRQDDLSHFWGQDGCDGAVLAAPYNYNQVIEQFREHACECVLVEYAGEPYEQLYPTIGVQNCPGIRLAMQHLFEQGHRRIGFITGRIQDASAQQRLFGYQASLEGAGIPFDPALVAEASWMAPENYVAAQALLQRDPQPTAIVASSDVGAFAAYRAAREMGLTVGRDISITGFDDMRSAGKSSPPLTTVRQPVSQLGQLAVELLLKRLKGEPLPHMSVRLETELIVRQSTGRVPLT